MRPVWKALLGVLVVASMTLTVGAIATLADSGGGDGGGGLEPSGPGPSITTEAVAQAIRAADDAEDLAKRVASGDRRGERRAEGQ